MDSRLVLTGSDDKSLKVFSLAERKFVGTYFGHKNWVRCVRFSPDARLIGSCGDDHTVKLWDVSKKTIIHTFIDHLETVRTLRFSPDGTCLASGSDDRKIKIFDIRSGRIIQHYDAHGLSVTCVGYHPSGKYLISSSMDSTLKIWDLLNGQILYTMHGHEGPINSCAFSRCGDYFCSGGADAILMIWKSNVMNELNAGVISKEIKTSSKLFEHSIGADNIKRKPEENKSSTAGTKFRKGNANKFTKNQKSSKNPSASNLNNNNKQTLKTTMKNTPGESAANLQVSQQSQTNNPLLTSQKSVGSASSNLAKKLPEELTLTFEKLISQLDIVVKTMKIMDQRIQVVENKVGELYNRQKKGIYKHYQGENTDQNNLNDANYEDNNYEEQQNLNDANYEDNNYEEQPPNNNENIEGNYEGQNILNNEELNHMEDNKVNTEEADVLNEMGTMKNYPNNLQQNNIFNQNLDDYEEQAGEEEQQQPQGETAEVLPNNQPPQGEGEILQSNPQEEIKNDNEEEIVNINNVPANNNQ